jgi:hypothetical protein
MLLFTGDCRYAIVDPETERLDELGVRLGVCITCG